MVLLAGIAGSLGPSCVVGNAYKFYRVRSYGIGVGDGAQFQSADQIGWNQLEGESDSNSNVVGDVISRSNESPNNDCQFKTSGELLSVCAASASPAEVTVKKRLCPDAIAEDMEGFAVAAACIMNNVPWVIVRGISNLAGDRVKSNWQTDDALQKAAEHVSRILAEVTMMQTIRLGISTCPNDTFAFHGLMEQRVDWRGLNFEIELLDIQELNNHLFNEHFDVAKASFHAAILLANQYIVLPSGSALGFGVGPLLLSSTRNAFPSQHDQLTLCPGAQTTATLLYDMFYPDVTRVEHVVFSEIMPRLEQSQADFGVCIHEGRFTWEASGLFLVEDLGARWETETQCPLPLGGIIGKRSLGDDVLSQVQNVIRDSLHYGIANPEEALATNAGPCTGV